MANITNISNSKIVTIGDTVLLPGQTKAVPEQFEKSQILKIYRDLGFCLISDAPVVAGFTAPAAEATEKENTVSEAEVAENLRKARLASLKGISEEGLGSLARELGINPADCRDQKDVLAKVRGALKKA